MPEIKKSTKLTITALAGTMCMGYPDQVHYNEVMMSERKKRVAHTFGHRLREALKNLGFQLR